MSSTKTVLIKANPVPMTPGITRCLFDTFAGDRTHTIDLIDDDEKLVVGDQYDITVDCYSDFDFLINGICVSSKCVENKTVVLITPGSLICRLELPRGHQIEPKTDVSVRITRCAK